VHRAIKRHAVEDGNDGSDVAETVEGVVWCGAGVRMQGGVWGDWSVRVVQRISRRSYKMRSYKMRNCIRLRIFTAKSTLSMFYPLLYVFVSPY
jgi:hypothetical protein